ncbi:NAD-dependent succinate-semialdehyde dehydrogenase [Frondihabitans sp. PAMC 28766]|uniref:NAD-dependent succinate-semialdehyde dehydrogenase n=1 Tax=Frondihabitans sp. PAMC 28766 TaxID=1795630 RepID=UPI00078C94B8|nr:NAD-dependent succinate-semialdehyde dehydrogenase [Frondihabitans sp. PAMC 28766]AMM22095.1 NAD-dependent succinate-semialdehyde dehydrogenase [Frondihabitans sp. PAMC 28766]
MTITATTEDRLLADVPSGLLVNGVWRPATGGETFTVIDPATGASLAEVADGTPADGIAALDAADDAAAGWAATPPRKRAEILRRAFDLTIEHTDDLALLMTMEMGKPLAEARGEVTYGAEFLRWFSEEAVRISGRYGLNPEGTGTTIVSHRPVGPCFLITPWNFPLAMLTRKIGPALAAGCTVVVKPAELTPLTSLYFAGLLLEAGVPAGVVNVVTTTDASGVSSAIMADPRLRKVSFTGSTAVGKILLKQAADNVLRTSMELGGNAPFVVFDDADIDKAVDGAMLAKFRNIGEACTAANRFFVQKGVADEFAAKLTARVEALGIGRGTDDGVSIGPLINEAAVSKSADLVADATSRGASVLTGGSAIDGPGTFFAPTVLSGIVPGTRLLREEIFGPVAAIATFDTEEDGVRLANDTEFGLIAYAYTTDLARGHRLMASLRAGMLGLNAGVVSNASAPFGGVKSSGLGREGGLEGIHEYLDTTYTMLPAS